MPRHIARHLGVLSSVLGLTMAVAAQVNENAAFSYQGRLKKSGALPTTAEGCGCDMLFELFESEDEFPGEMALDSQQFLDVPLEKGLFTVEIDFGENWFDGTEKWLQLSVMCPDAACLDTATVVLPRQQITPTPYALQSLNTQRIDVIEDGATTTATVHAPAGRKCVLHLAPDAVDGQELRLETGGTGTGWSVSNDPLADDTLSITALDPGVDPQTTVPMSITRGGRVGLGTNAPEQQLHVTSANPQILLEDTEGTMSYSLAAVSNSFRIKQRTVGKPGDYDALLINAFGYVSIGPITADHELDVLGTIEATGGCICPSDARLKNNITDLPDGLEKILALRGVEFDWDIARFPDWRFDEGRRLGLIAQEVREVLPEVVNEDGQYLALDYDGIVPVLVEAVKDLHREVTRRDEEVTDLRARVAALEALVERSLQDGP